MEYNNASFDLGFTKVEAVPATAFAGYAGRVHGTEKAAIVDLATCTLANRWLKNQERNVPFAKFLDMIADDPDLAEAAVKLARYRAA